MRIDAELLSGELALELGRLERVTTVELLLLLLLALQHRKARTHSLEGLTRLGEVHLDVGWRLQRCLRKIGRDRAVKSLSNLLLLIFLKSNALLKGLCCVFGDLVDWWACVLA